MYAMSKVNSEKDWNTDVSSEEIGDVERLIVGLEEKDVEAIDEA
jgi:hypothetical protein